MLRRHGDNKAPQMPSGKKFQQTVVAAMKRLHIKEGIDLPRKVGK
jgi:hypothetical protein